MPIARFLLTLWLAAALLLTPALGETDTSIPVCMEDDLEPQAVHDLPDGSFLICGSEEGYSPATRPFLLTFDRNGRVLWSMDTSSLPGGLYRDAIQIGDGELAAIFCPFESGSMAIHHIVDGQITSIIDGYDNLFDVVRVDGGYLASSKPLDRRAAVIDCYSMDDALLWRLDLPKPIFFHGILAGEEIHVAYGYQVAPEGSGQNGYAVAFDADGQILWQYESPFNDSFVGAAWSPDGNPVFISEMLHDEYCAVTEIGPDGALWRIQHFFTDPGSTYSCSEMYAILALPDGYLVAACGVTIEPGKHNESAETVRLLRYDLEGRLVAEWHERMGSLTKYFLNGLFERHGEITLISSGQIASELWTIIAEARESNGSSGVFVNDIPRVTMIKEIELES